MNEGMREEEEEEKETQHSRALAARNRSRHRGYIRTPGPTWRRVSHSFSLFLSYYMPLYPSKYVQLRAHWRGRAYTLLPNCVYAVCPCVRRSEFIQFLPNGIFSRASTRGHKGRRAVQNKVFINYYCLPEQLSLITRAGGPT